MPDTPAQQRQRRDGGAFASPTLEDVARRAGVSTATVSRCLNKPASVSEATRARVLDVVRSIGYAPNFVARALAARRTNTFGAIVPTMENAIFARGLQAFQEELATRDVTMLVASSSYDAKTEEEQIRALVARGADALLLIGHDRTPESYAFMARRQVPHVVTWAYEAGAQRCSIGFDNRKAMRRLTERVLEFGHRRLGLITALRGQNDRARARHAGLLDAMRAHGLDAGNLSIVETPYSIENGARALARLAALRPRPTAVLCGNDVLAAGALCAARKLGLDTPGDISLTGFDDIEISGIVTPALTTVHVPHRKMGRAAAQRLIAMRDGAEAGPGVELEASVVLRDSLGPAPAE